MLKGAMVSDPTALAEWTYAACEHGAVALIDKEEGWTSHDCVARLRTLLHTRRIGHAGTLDPLATGLLIVCVGKATKDVDDFQEEQKTYEVVAKLGAVTATDDRGADEEPYSGEGVVDLSSLAPSHIEEALLTFMGEQVQVPPAYSAIKQGGRRQYELARAGKPIIPKPRCVTIHELQVEDITMPFMRFTMVCSKGTYVRSVVRDLGRLLGTGAYVWSLRRTQSGQYQASDAVTMTALNSAFAKVAA